MTKLAIVLADGFADWECALVMAWGQTYMGIEITVATPGGQPVTSLGGLKVTPDIALENIGPEVLGGLVICGGSIWQSAQAPDLDAVAKRFMEANKLVAAICDGVLGLARTGVLNDRAHTGDGLEILERAPAYSGGSQFRKQPKALRDGNLITASGLAPVSFMSEVFIALGYGGPELDQYVGMLGAEHV
ncbi:DJ-1/PfpI family protein [Pelagibacterium lentulum]|uniref:Glutamine amidotransferase n=1 Tax=Pelagibacterium lentulum TaxID=2029865 RepID=A0A916R5D2_9HYPH|nr:DJ-1/PfpI family protein [Pelagibacterium lentulum]GGA35445.1 glutamine amidotransferase [Pelagibacterium lentulum]